MGRKKYYATKQLTEDEKRQAAERKAELKRRRETMRAMRSSGMNPQMQKLVKTNPDMDVDSVHKMMEDTRGIKKRNANKMVRSLMSGLDDDGFEMMQSVVSNSVDANLSAPVKDMIKHQKRVQETQDAEDAKKNEKFNASNTTIYNPENGDVKEGGRTFDPLPDFKTPSLTDFASMNASSESGPADDDLEEMPSTSLSLEELERMMDQGVNADELPDLNAKEVKQVGSLQDRLNHLSNFNGKVDMQEEVLINGGELKKIVSIDRLVLPTIIRAPKTSRVMMSGDVHKDIRQRLDNGEEYIIVKKHVYEKKFNKYVKTKNCVGECSSFLSRFSKVWKWIRKLENQHIPKEWFIDYMWNLGIYQKVPGIWYLYGPEYTSPVDDNLRSVAEIPFFAMDL